VSRESLRLGRVTITANGKTSYRSFPHQLCTAFPAEPISFRPISSDRPRTARMDHPYPSLHAGTLRDDPRRLVGDQLAHTSVACSSG
jgi:hypothetical protein